MKNNSELKIFNLNECAMFRKCFYSTEAPMAVKRSVRPFIKALKNAFKDATEEYGKITEKITEGKKPEDLKKEEVMEMSNKIDKEISAYNSSIYPAIDFDRESTLNFFARFWSTFSWSSIVDTSSAESKNEIEHLARLADDIDEKVVELYPQLDVDLDKPEEGTGEVLRVKKEPTEETVEDAPVVEEVKE